MVSALRRARERRRDQRGAMTVVELIVASTLGLMVLAFAGTMFSTLSMGAMATDKRTAAQLQTRDALESAMRYLRNSVPLASCAQWTTTGEAYNKLLTSGAKKCLRWKSDSGVVASDASPTSFTTYAYADATDVMSGAAPDKLKFEIRDNQLVVSKATFRDGNSMQAAWCRAENKSVGDCSGLDADWGDFTQVWAFPVSASSVFTFLVDDGTVLQNLTNSESIRTVIVDLSVQYTPTDAQKNYLEASFPFYASVALRGSRFADELNPGKR